MTKSNRQMQRVNQRMSVGGYTLIEVMVILGLTAIIGTVAVTNLPLLFRSTKLLDDTTDALVARLINTQQKSVSQTDGAKWGVHLDATTAGRHFYQIFYGDSYASGTVTETVNIYPEINFINPYQGATDDIIFERVTGVPVLTHGIILALSNNPSIYRYISVLNGSGLITRSNVAPPQNFLVSLSPTSGTVAAGGSITSNVTVTLSAGIPASAVFSASNLPFGVTANFSPASCTPTCTTVMTLTTSASTPLASTVIPVTATSGTAVASANFTLTVTTSVIASSGYIWSNNIGWISLNCSNTSTCGTVNYGLTADYNTGLMSGYAWSANVGWISFTVSDLAGCPSGTCEARVSGGLTGVFPKTVTGWAKILAVTDGWMHLTGTAQDASAYGVSLASNKNLSGYSWDASVAGWTSWRGTAQDASVYGGQINW